MNKNMYNMRGDMIPPGTLGSPIMQPQLYPITTQVYGQYYEYPGNEMYNMQGYQGQSYMQ